MIPRLPYAWDVGQTLSPDRLTGQLRRMAADINTSMSRRYTYSQIVFPLYGIASTDTWNNSLIFAAPFNYDIVSAEVVYYGSANLTRVTFSVGGTQLTVYNAGVGIRSTGTWNTSKHINTITNSQFGIVATASTGAWNIEGGELVVTIRTDRGNAGLSYPDLTYLESNLPAPGAASSETKLNTEIAKATASIAADIAADRCMRIEARVWRNVPAGALTADRAKFRVPQSLRRLSHLWATIVCAATSSVTFSLQNAVPADVASTTVVGAGVVVPATSGLVTAGVSQPLDTPYTSANDYFAAIARSSGTDVIKFAYLLFFWS